ncbi:hypothetical protein niasHT_021802 [Heterodera trifolii]|uniref:Peptidase M41 domain-containing protein n=1 Tax=Heterodera trifolii TaxID=157864 RepID=A0ABD2J8J3_9BILA
MARRKRKPRYAKYGKIDGRSRFGRYKRKYNDLLGPALQGMQNLLVTAYHECAHAFCIKYGQNNIDILNRVTIRAQDGNLGETHWHDVQGIYTDEQLFAQIVQFMAGRAVELLIFHNAQGHEEDVQSARNVTIQETFCNYVKWRKRKRQSTDCSKKQQKRRLNFS